MLQPPSCRQNTETAVCNKKTNRAGYPEWLAPERSHSSPENTLIRTCGNNSHTSQQSKLFSKQERLPCNPGASLFSALNYNTNNVYNTTVYSSNISWREHTPGNIIRTIIAAILEGLQERRPGSMSAWFMVQCLISLIKATCQPHAYIMCMNWLPLLYFVFFKQ